MPKVYIVEDDGDIRELVLYALKTDGFEATGFETGDAFFDGLVLNTPDIVLLDIMLPGKNGLSILKTLRNGENPNYRDLPVIMLTAKGSEFDKVKGLDAGADDYVVKPFGVTELISRINAVLRRSRTTQETGNVLKYKNILLDTASRNVSVDGDKIKLTFKEYELLRYLLQNKEVVLSRERITEIIWGYDYGGENRTIDMHIKTLRQKLGAAGEHIKTIRNIGYKLGE